jgi:hypothetical protein
MATRCCLSTNNLLKKPLERLTSSILKSLHLELVEESSPIFTRLREGKFSDTGHQLRLAPSAPSLSAYPETDSLEKMS